MENIRTALHEVSHLLVYWKGSSLHGHDKFFIEMFRKLMIENDIPLPVDDKYYIHADYYLNVFCKDCGHKMIYHKELYYPKICSRINILNINC